MKVGSVLFGSSPGATVGEAAKVAFLRALRTFIQGVAAALVAAGAAKGVVDASYLKTFEYSVITAAITAAASFLQNVATFLPDDPTQKPLTPGPNPNPNPNPAPNA